MDERAAAATLKRKREDEEEQEHSDESAGEAEQPKAVQDAQAPKAKKRKAEGKSIESSKNKESPQETVDDRRRRKIEERAAKRERKREKKAKAKEKLDRQKAKKQGELAESLPQKKEAQELHLQIPVDLGAAPAEDSGEDSAPASPSTAVSEELVEVFSPPHESGTSSTSSIHLASLEETITASGPAPSKHPQLLPTELPPAPISTPIEPDTAKSARERLQQALSQFRAHRKADGTDGRAPKNRQELLDQRRRKEEAKKAAKKEQKRREREEEARRQDEEIARRFSPGGSGSLLESPRSPIIGDDNNSNNNFTFGRIAFADGTNFDSTSTSAITSQQTKRGPKARDTASQLALASAKKSRLATLDEDTRADLEQKDMWLNAKRRAHGTSGERDDTSLLKKALKRQQSQKRKSEREWTERTEGVKKAQDARQKKRTENLARRKDEKGSKKAGKHGVKVKRPGFEGSFKGRTGGGKRKS